MNLEHIIRRPYTTRPYMTKNTGQIYSIVSHPSMIESKKTELSIYNQDLCGSIDDSVVDYVIAQLQLNLAQNIRELAMFIEEDLAIIHNGVLSAICFCYPSNWIPTSRLGQTLQQLHEPVADSDKLQAASQHIAEKIADPELGSFTRSVWTINCVPHQNNHPNEIQKYSAVPVSLENLYFRTEIQTTLPMPDKKTSVFFVKVTVTPLLDIWAQNQSIILAGINSMSENILRYKNMASIKQYLNSLP